jgi:hypothetical protein
MSFVLGYVVNEGVFYINDVPHSSGRGVRMDFEISGEEANALGGLIISQSGKRIAVTAAVTWYRGIRELLIFLILMLLIILTGTTETDLEDGQERLLKLLYLKVSLIMDQVLLQQ